MPLNLGNAQEIVATKISLIQGSNVVNILDLIGGGGGGGGGGIVTSVTAPLSISSGVLSIDLNPFATQAFVAQELANYTLTSQLFSGVTVGTGLLASAGSGTLTISLTGTDSRAALKLSEALGKVGRRRGATVDTRTPLAYVLRDRAAPLVRNRPHCVSHAQRGQEGIRGKRR